MGKTKRKRSATYRRRQTKNRRKAKIEMTKRACKDENRAQMPIPQRPPSPIATELEVARKDCSSGQVDAKGEHSYFPEEHSRDVEDKECTNCQCLCTLLYQEQCKPRVFHSEGVQCKSKRQAKTVKVILQDVLRGVSWIKISTCCTCCQEELSLSYCYFKAYLNHCMAVCYH